MAEWQRQQLAASSGGGGDYGTNRTYAQYVVYLSADMVARLLAPRSFAYSI